ncbi:MAG: hypothetical protein MRJ65_08910 [Candidatus Brocadiaceae bacterium]|nr:hypothetical protein [Candidatus Brocadiaceae bacterium]
MGKAYLEMVLQYLRRDTLTQNILLTSRLWRAHEYIIGYQKHEEGSEYGISGDF